MLLYRQLIGHLRSEHTRLDGSKPCPSCSESFSKVMELARHLQLKHGYPMDNDLGLSLARLNGNACYFEGCAYKNPHADSLQRHMYQRHSVGQPTLPCPSCSRTYFSIGFVAAFLRYLMLTFCILKGLQSKEVISSRLTSSIYFLKPA